MDDADATLPKRPCGAPPTPPIATDPLRLSSSSMDAFLESFLGLFLSSTTTTTDPSLDLSPSLERILEPRVSSDQDRLIHGALTLGSLLLKAANHSQRKRFSDHNSLAWILPIDLTVKVFSMLDTESLCHAAAACSMFHKCAMDSLCYAEIDLRSILPKVNNAIVNTMVQRAGKNLQSLKLGVLPYSDASAGPSCPIVYTFRNSTDARFSWNDRRSRQGKESYVLTRSCLASLSADGGSAGALLRKLYLYNIDRMDNAALSAALSACPSLLDLEIVGLNLGSGTTGHLLEVLILRDCMHLKEDISNKEGLASDSDWYDRCYSPSFIEIDHMLNSEVNSDGSSPSQISSPSSDVSFFMTSSESSYNSDQGSGNEDGRHLNFQFYEESSDEVDDFLAI
ncbi:hypothetical protein Syun_007459 [Stephania yunnanensis]|uniref:F-box domain-containing protein n=1 Tax=Stephania yunnanensis TaxID=152371 RepID=A0AAP0L013_9MAGN